MCPLNTLPEKSDKLKQIGLYLQKEGVIFYADTFYSSNNRFRYSVNLNRFDFPVGFPYISKSAPISMASGRTTVNDELECEKIEIPYYGSLVLRIKGHRKGSIVQGYIRMGHLEISDIRRFDVIKHPEETEPTILISGYLDAEDTIIKG